MRKRITNEEFVAKAKEVHGDWYDYSKVEYVTTYTKVCIICPKHGEFWQAPSKHLSGQGCPKCGGTYKKDTNDFIRKAKEIHGDKYDYSKVEYKNNRTKVCIICPEHGEFWQVSSYHLSGNGCPKCGGTIKMDSNTFIIKAREIHGDKYDYSKVEYVNARTKVCIICPEHGEFWQTPDRHLSGRGCKKCGIIKRSNKLRGNIAEFVIKAKEIHGDRYDYSKAEYSNTNTKLCIVCPEHGEFWQSPVTHLKGHGCPKCSGNAKLSMQTFSQKAKEVHGDRYDYSKVNYINAQTKVCIICPEHGEFWQTPNSHLKGNGCPKCGGRNKLDNESFVIKAREIHGNRYDYSKVNYINHQTKVCIICPKHGEFWQIPVSHLSGSGCPKCAGRMMSTKEWIERAKLVHGNRYDYSKVEYIDSATKVCIICPEHGEFWQIPPSHLSGCGCYICNIGYNREYKFNLLEEFIDEYRLRDFLMTNDENLIYVILRNIEKIDPKFNPIVNDIDRVLRSDSTNPIEDLEDKYRAQDETVTVDTVVEENNTTNINDIDLDDDDAIEAFISNTTTTAEKTEPTIDELTRAREK